MPQFDASTLSSYTGKWLIGTGVFELLLAAGFVIGGVAAPNARSGLWLTAAILGAVGIGLVWFGMRSRARAANARRIDETGQAGQATITGLTQTGMFLNENPQVEMDLMVQVPGRPPYAVKRKEFVPLILLGRLSTGAPLPVKVDPADPNSVIIEWDAPTPAVQTQGWWGTPGASAPPAPAAPGETLTEVAQALQAAGLQAEKPFASPEQGNYTVDQLREWLRANGIEGTATIDELEDTGKIVGNEHMFVMAATVNVPGHPPHKTGRSAAMVPITAVPKVAVGKTLPVRVAPDNPDMVTFEWERI
jgi:hypothetical protein